jgi:hypothetical protein
MNLHESQRMQTDVWLTPPWIVNELGPFDLDPCAPLQRPWDTARKHYTINDNGLLSPWEGRVWLNPPYNKEAVKWLRLMKRHKNGTALIFARTETKWFFETVWGTAYGVLFLKGRLNFYTCKGEEAKHSAGAPSVLVAYSKYDAERLRDSSIEGAFLGLI